MVGQIGFYYNGLDRKMQRQNERARPRKLRITRPRVKHAVSFALLLVLSKPKHRFGFVRRNGGADVELSGLPGKRNGASPFGRRRLHIGG